MGDLVPLEWLSFRNVRKPLIAENRGLWILQPTVNIFDNTIEFARYDGTVNFGF